MILPVDFENVTNGVFQRLSGSWKPLEQSGFKNSTFYSREYSLNNRTLRCGYVQESVGAGMPSFHVINTADKTSVRNSFEIRDFFIQFPSPEVLEALKTISGESEIEYCERFFKTAESLLKKELRPYVFENKWVTVLSAFDRWTNS